MRSLSAAVLTKLDEGRIAIRGMMLFLFGTGTYRFWTGSAPLVYDGGTWLPGGILEVSEIPGSVGLSAEGITITLAEAPADGLTPAALAAIENEDYHQRPVTLSDLYIDPDTSTILFMEPVWRGYVDTITHDEGPNAALTIQCESRALDNSRLGYRKRSHADQQLVSPGDRIFEHAEVAGKVDVFWGRKKPK